MVSPDALYRAALEDVKEYIPFGPVGLGNIPPDASYKQFVSSYFISNLIRKFEPLDTSIPDTAAKGKFLASNKKCKDWSLHLDSWLDELLYGEFCREIDRFFHPEGHLLFSSFYELIERARVGPGSSIGALGQSFYAKIFSSQMTTTSSELNSVFRAYFEWFPTFDEALAECRRKYGDPKYVRGSRVSFAPKTSDCSRMICVEPNLNMFFQLGLGTILEERLKSYYGVSLSAQPLLNRLLARFGSKTGQFATIDLSSASDSISLRMCSNVLPAWFFETLLALRSDSTELDGDYVKLWMMSTMGNGFTFPLQTVIFSCLIRAAYSVANVSVTSADPSDPGNFPRNWGCFGDDLVVHNSCYRFTSRLLHILGFEENSAKTFNEGQFRESCGTDWFCGQPVRPVFVKRLDSLQDILVTINALNDWTSNTGIPLRNAVQFLISKIRMNLPDLFVPRYENMDSGIRVPSSYLPRESLVFDRNLSLLYRPFRPVSKKIRIGDGKLHFPRGVKELMWNPGGLHISFLYGELEKHAISVRHDRVRYVQGRQGVPSPFWDWDVPVHAAADGRSVADRRRWETAVWINIHNPG